MVLDTFRMPKNLMKGFRFMRSSRSKNKIAHRKRFKPGYGQRSQNPSVRLGSV